MLPNHEFESARYRLPTEYEYLNIIKNHINSDDTYEPRGKHKPVFSDTACVWAAAATGQDLTYAFWYGGTNDLKIGVYDPVTDQWSKIEAEKLPITSIYPLLWKIITELAFFKNRSSFLEKEAKYYFKKLASRVNITEKEYGG